MKTYEIKYEPTNDEGVLNSEYNIYYYGGEFDSLKEFHSTDGINGEIREGYTLKSILPSIIKRIKNVDSGSIIFNSVNTKNILFTSTFSTIPDVNLTMDGLIISPPYKINVTKNGFTVKLQTKYTGTITWTAIQI